MNGERKNRANSKAVFTIALLACLAVPSNSLVPSIFGKSLALRTETKHAFDAYVARTETRNQKDLRGGSFLWADDLDKSATVDAYARLKRGEVLTRQINGPDQDSDIPGGLVHDWEGLVFVPGAKLNDVVSLLQDYDHQATYFSPDVERSRIEEHDGDHFRVFLRFRQKNVFTLVLNTEHDIVYFRDSSARVRSRSSAIRIAEVDNPGERDEKEKTPGQDNGLLWRMETWWRIEEKDGGVYVQNEVVTLTRDIPTGLGWAVEPFLTSIPKESLQFTLSAIRQEVLKRRPSISSQQASAN
jgi:hypothetical protein